MRGSKHVRLRLLLSIALGIVTVLGAATIGQARAAIRKIAHHHHVRIVKAPAPQLRRVCDWIGPGARAVYRCSYVDPQPVHMTFDVAPQLSCDWIGPGARAVYRCK
jgi:hypothetical protein